MATKAEKERKESKRSQTERASHIISQQREKQQKQEIEKNTIFLINYKIIHNCHCHNSPRHKLSNLFKKNKNIKKNYLCKRNAKPAPKQSKIALFPSLILLYYIYTSSYVCQFIYFLFCFKISKYN